LLPALAGLLFLSSLAGAAGLTLETRDRLRRVRYALQETPATAEMAVPLHSIVRGYAIIFRDLATGGSSETGYWKRAARDYVRLGKIAGTHLFDLDNRVVPEPMPIHIRAGLRRVAGRLMALSAGGSGGYDYWHGVAVELRAVLQELSGELFAVQDMILGDAPNLSLPAHLSLYYLGVSLGSQAPSGQGGLGYWRRCAEDQVALSRGMGLAVANYVRFMQQPVRRLLLEEAAALRAVMQQPVRRLLLEEAAALRAVKLAEADDLDTWYREAHRLQAVLASHRAVLFLLSDELR
jgi:hypothetical protein